MMDVVNNWTWCGGCKTVESGVVLYCDLSD